MKNVFVIALLSIAFGVMGNAALWMYQSSRETNVENISSSEQLFAAYTPNKNTDPTSSLALTRQAQVLANAYMQKDVEAIVDSMPLMILELMDRQSLIDQVNIAIESGNPPKLKVNYILTGLPSKIVRDEVGLTAFLPTQMNATIGEEQKQVTLTSYLFCVFEKDSATWRFISGDNLPSTFYAKVAPNLIAAAPIPERHNSLIEEVHANIRNLERQKNQPFSEHLESKAKQFDDYRSILEKHNLLSTLETKEGKKFDEIGMDRIEDFIKEHRLQIIPLGRP